MQNLQGCQPPLHGVRVADFTWALAGPYATMLLAFLGAEVIKIESSVRLDLSRRMYMAPGAKPEEINKATSFSDFNHNKLGITLNLQQPHAIDLVRQIISVSDVVVDNFSPGVMERLGLGYPTLRSLRPDIVMVSSSAMGGTGPESSYVGYAPTFNSLSGVGFLTGYPDRPPGEIRTGVDLRVGATIAFAVLVAVNCRLRTGRGQYVDVSAREAMSALVGDSFLEYTIGHRVPVRDGNRDRIMAPHGCYRCKGEDKWVTIAVGTEEEWAAFCRAIGGPPWTRNSKFQDQHSRWLHQEEMDKHVEAWTSGRSPYEVTALLQREGVAAFPSMSSEDLYKDPHLREREAYGEVTHPEIGRRIVFRPPFRLPKTPARITTAGPLLGEHSSYVFSELLGLQNLAELQERKVVI
ncbi:MAG: CoA transferase [Chloroflexi bacterium]|nr:CoA transferase [Chloroflexota bacterium]